jgi:hypothetical protein
MTLSIEAIKSGGEASGEFYDRQDDLVPKSLATGHYCQATPCSCFSKTALRSDVRTGLVR